jgi:predicted nuclease of predicted toxin-antitoxin system
VRRFVIDNQLPAALAQWCEAQGCTAEHVLALQMAQAPDDWIWQHAAQTGATIITKDEDFSRMTVLRPEPVAVVWLRFGNCRTPTLLTKMEKAWPDIIRQLDAGTRLIEVF